MDLNFKVECLPYDCEYGPHCYKFSVDGYSEICYSPHGAAEQSGYTTTYLQYLCKNRKIDCFMYQYLWFIPLKQVKELKKRKAEKDGNV